MSDQAIKVPRGKRSGLPVLSGFVLMLGLGWAGFEAVRLGLVPGLGTGTTVEASKSPAEEVSFVPVEPLVIFIGEGAGGRHLRFSSEIEVRRGEESEVVRVMPRVLDVMNTYLRAVDTRTLEDPAALVRIRAHLTRRLKLVAGEDRVRDLLVTEFIIN